MAKRSFWAARPFGYGEQYPRLDVGQVIKIEVGQQPNDEALIRLGLLREVSGERPVQCGKCGAEFVDDGYLNRHGRARHTRSDIESGRSEMPNADRSTAEALGELRALEEQDDFATKNIPLNMEKTKATKESGRTRRASR